jgi:hypothetical protein
MAATPATATAKATSGSPAANVGDGNWAADQRPVPDPVQRGDVPPAAEPVHLGGARGCELWILADGHRGPHQGRGAAPAEHQDDQCIRHLRSLGRKEAPGGPRELPRQAVGSPRFRSGPTGRRRGGFRGLRAARGGGGWLGPSCAGVCRLGCAFPPSAKTNWWPRPPGCLRSRRDAGRGSGSLLVCPAVLCACTRVMPGCPHG